MNKKTPPYFYNSCQENTNLNRASNDDLTRHELTSTVDWAKRRARFLIIRFV